MGSMRSEAAVGDLIAGKYRLVRALGTSRSGPVFAAQHVMLHANVTMELLAPALARDPEAIERFLGEARAAAGLEHPSLARVIDVEHAASGEVYVVREPLEGESLASVARGRRLPIGQAVSHVVRACRALAEARRSGIAARDVQPANLFFSTASAGASLKVLDLGASCGFSSYMAPEQVAGRATDARSDVWSLGAILFELLGGKPAFDGPSAGAIAARILGGRRAPLRALRKDAPSTLVSIVDRALFVGAQHRFADADELATALEAAMGALVVVTPPPSLPDFRQSDTLSSLAPAVLPPAPAPRAAARRAAAPSLLAALTGPAVVAIAAALTALVLGLGAESAPARGAADGARSAAATVQHLSATRSAAIRGKQPAVVAAERAGARARHSVMTKRATPR